jgi:hypothetical protein
MTELENPFTPSFGELPAHVAGRRQILAEVGAAFVKKTRSPELTCLFSGARGMGKTTLLSLLAHRAEEAGWICVDATALPGMLDDIEIGIRRGARHLLGESSAPRLSGVELAGVGAVSFADAGQEKSNWRSRVSEMLERLDQTETGLLLTVDEVNPSLPELVELVAVYQHFVREGRKVALLMAGLPGKISSLLNDETVSFLRRAQSFSLTRVSDLDIAEALRMTIVENGRTADGRGIETAVRAIGGFPFLLQLVGYRSWNMHPDVEEMSLQDFEDGIDAARREMRARIHEATYRELSPGDRKFLRAMLADEGNSRTADLTARLKWAPSQVAQYRKRLVDAGVVECKTRGTVEFAIPFFREFLRESE